MAPPEINTRRAIAWTFDNGVGCTFDTNAQATVSFSQILGKVDDHFGLTLKLDKELWYELFSMTLFGIINGLAWTYSHEVGHIQDDLDRGYGDDFLFSMKYPVLGFIPRPFIDPAPKGTAREIAAHVGNGLNQQQFNLIEVNKQVREKNTITPIEAVAYASNKLAILIYILSTQHLQSNVHDEGVNFDPPLYRHAMSDISPKHAFSGATYIACALLATVFDGSLANYIGAIENYLRTGNRYFEPFSFDVGNGVTILLPETNLFHHPDGLFLDVNLPLKKKKSFGLSAILNFGMGLTGGLNAYRIGAEVGDITFYNHPSSPVLGLGVYETIRPDKDLGQLYKLTVGFPLPYSSKIHFEVHASKNDIIDTDIKNRAPNILGFQIDDFIFSWMITLSKEI